MKKLFALIASFACLATAPAAHAQADVSEIVDLTSLIRVVRNPANPSSGNLRVIVPFMNATPGTNGIPQRVTIRFNLYDPTSGNNSILFQSAPRAVNLPVPCTSPSSWDEDYSIKFFGRWNGVRATMILGYSVVCFETGTGQRKEARSTIVYSADVTQPPPAASSWARSYALELIGANSLDLTDGSGTLAVQDGVGETLMLTLEGSTGPRIVMLNFDTGDLFSNPGWTMPADRSYPTGNF